MVLNLFGSLYVITLHYTLGIDIKYFSSLIFKSLLVVIFVWYLNRHICNLLVQIAIQNLTVSALLGLLLGVF